MKTQQPPAPFISLPHSRTTLWDTTPSSPRPLQAPTTPKRHQQFHLVPAAQGSEPFSLSWGSEWQPCRAWSLLPLPQPGLSPCYPSNKTHFPPGKASTEPRSTVGGTWLQPPSGTSAYSCSQAHHKDTSHSSHPPGMQGCRDGTVHRSPLTVIGEFNSSKNHSQPNPTGGNTVKTRLAPAATPCLLPAQPTQAPTFPSTGSQIILADPGCAEMEDGVGVSGCLDSPTAAGTGITAVS